MGTARARSDVDARCDRDAFQKAIFTFVWCKHVCISSTRTIIKNTSFSFRLPPSTCTWSRGRIFNIYYFVCPPHHTKQLAYRLILFGKLFTQSYLRRRRSLYAREHFRVQWTGRRGGHHVQSVWPKIKVFCFS